MSAPPHEGWPREGSVWEHWSDLLLATQLAALRSGFTGAGKRWELAQPQRLVIRCDVRATALGGVRCQQWLVRAKPLDPVNLAGAWVVDLVRTENLDVRQHSNHHGGIGTTRGFKSPPAKRPKLWIGRIVKNWKAMHLLEGSLRSSARQEGRFIAPYPKPTQYETASVPLYSYYFRCVLGDRCNFYISFVPHEQEDGMGWRCDKLCLAHSCATVALKPSAMLKQVLDFWPDLKVVGDYSSATNRVVQQDRKASLTKTDQHLGDYPVLAPGQTTVRQVVLLQAPESVKVAGSQATSSSAKAQLPSSKDCQRTVKLLELIEARKTAAQQSRLNHSSNQPLPLAPPPVKSATSFSSITPSTTQLKVRNKEDSLIRALDSLFTTRRFFLDLEHNISIASALGDTASVVELSSGMVEMKVEIETKGKRVEKRKRKLEKLKEMMERERMEQIKIETKKTARKLKKARRRERRKGKEKKTSKTKGEKMKLSA